MSDNFPAHSILLSCEGECGESGPADVGWVGGGCRVGLVAESEGDIHEAERLVCGIGGRVCVLARPEQEKETQCCQVCCGEGHGFSGQVGNQVDVIDDGEWNGLYARGRRVDPFVAFELLLDPVFDFSTGVEAAIFGPHAGHRLADGA